VQTNFPISMMNSKPESKYDDSESSESDEERGPRFEESKGGEDQNASLNESSSTLSTLSAIRSAPNRLRSYMNQRGGSRESQENNISAVQGIRDKLAARRAKRQDNSVARLGTREETSSSDDIVAFNAPSHLEQNNGSLEDKENNARSIIRKSTVGQKESISSEIKTTPLIVPKFFRREPRERMDERMQERMRIAFERIPEVHFLGEISFGESCSTSSDVCISCRWRIDWGKSWSSVAGECSGQSQYSLRRDDGHAIWNHPIDLHLISASVQGWPRMIVQLWELDEYGRAGLAGYGFCHLPVNVGQTINVDIPCWRPCGTSREELEALFLGTKPILTNDDIIFGSSWKNRCRIVTVSAGKVHLSLSVILRHFSEHRVDQAR